jgi:hypothetical protein
MSSHSDTSAAGARGAALAAAEAGSFEAPTDEVGSSSPPPAPAPPRSGTSCIWKSKGLKPGYHVSGSRVEPGAFKLRVNWIQLVQPPTAAAAAAHRQEVVGQEPSRGLRQTVAPNLASTSTSNATTTTTLAATTGTAGTTARGGGARDRR